MSEVLKLKSIYELLYDEKGNTESFFIPSYQRGYRWTKQQVVELLEDIWEFICKKNKDQNEFYCLQPIVVKKNQEHDLKWDVIDGQQRLTTIFIILKILSDKIESDIKTFNIDYATRTNSSEFLKSTSSQEDTTNIDFFYMSKAYSYISEWFLSKANNGFPTIKSKFISPFLEDVRVIWYEIGNTVEQDDIEIFTRINMGKIPLTNAELIKALLIQGYNDGTQNKQFELASEWDFIEYSLQNDDFWYFINKDKNEKATRIEFIFELIAEEYIKDKKDLTDSLNKSIDSYYEFHIINHYLKNDLRTAEEKDKETIHQKLWRQVKNYFRILNEWYEDREYFHKIGFLLIYSKKTILEFIAEYSKANSTKTHFKDFVNNQIIDIFKKIIIEELNYADRDSVRKVLLMFNINTILENEASNMRFEFDRYKKQDWDIEHIRSQSDRYPIKKEEKKAWIQDILDMEKVEKTEDEILNMRDQDFKQFFNTLQEQIEGDSSDFEKDDIGNLTLLDSATNRSYGNAFFPMKRKTIIENDKNGTFIPICTRNLFLKYYSKNATDLQKWTKEDAESYKDAIVTSFKNLFKTGVQHGN